MSVKKCIHGNALDKRHLFLDLSIFHISLKVFPNMDSANEQGFIPNT
jgi:hypothetical protein